MAQIYPESWTKAELRDRNRERDFWKRSEVEEKTKQRGEEEEAEADVPSGASLRALPVISLSPTSQT